MIYMETKHLSHPLKSKQLYSVCNTISTYTPLIHIIQTQDMTSAYADK